MEDLNDYAPEPEVHAYLHSRCAEGGQSGQCQCTVGSRPQRAAQLAVRVVKVAHQSRRCIGQLHFQNPNYCGMSEGGFDGL